MKKIALLFLSLFCFTFSFAEEELGNQQEPAVQPVITQEKTENNAQVHLEPYPLTTPSNSAGTSEQNSKEVFATGDPSLTYDNGEQATPRSSTKQKKQPPKQNGSDKAPSTPFMKLDFKSGWFRPTSHILREIYHSGGGFYQLEFDVTVWNGLTVFTEGDYFTRRGKSLGEGDKTKIHIGGYSFGLQYNTACASWLDFYVGVGPKFFFFRSIDHNPNVRKYTSKNGVGVVGKSGFYWYLPKNFFIDTFFEYSYCEMHFSGAKNKPTIPFSLDVGGMSLGGGLGYRF